ncbi:magnesium transporter CorA family protein [Effusibacillus lacus]|uniref:Magnesium transporter CorA n=1 Tax=Effusibacillus lacus TaxID=1348429 RepID=A0A292YSL8_9BACL|nr:magnesium transporter CorA family protein [Effusibacillus lacus]TCS75844.1 magnesium transporter [Effusibacillus lacus]GAX91763.1 magnesium transporter CorA [Effusibacillus lacus]
MLLFDTESNEIRNIEPNGPIGDKEVAWIHFEGHQVEQTYEFIKNYLRPHKLAFINLFRNNYQPKFHQYKDHAFMTLFGITGLFDLKEINILIGENFVLTSVQEPMPLFKDIKEGFLGKPQNMAHSGHVLYHILDELAENHLHQADKISGEIQSIAKQVFDNPFSNDIGHKIFEWRSRLHIVRKCVEEEVELVRQISRSDLPFINEESGFYFQDLEDDFTRVLNAFEAFQDQMLGIIDLQTSLKADHMNSIMKTLTMVSVIFIPITFLAGIYGMNFEEMPELKWKYGYPALWLVLLTIASVTIGYFRKRRWW